MRRGGPTPQRVTLPVEELARAVGIEPERFAQVLARIVEGGGGSIVEGHGRPRSIRIDARAASRLGLYRKADGTLAAFLDLPPGFGEHEERRPRTFAADMQAYSHMATYRGKQPWEEAAEAEEAALN